MVPSPMDYCKNICALRSVNKINIVINLKLQFEYFIFLYNIQQCVKNKLYKQFSDS